ncbi:MAG: hypothetical protein ABIN55_07810 [Aeromicrobium sp.]
MTSRFVRLLLATLLGVATAGVIAAPAQAVACPKGTGVTVVVNNSDVRCDAGGAGHYAIDNFTRTGHSITYVSSEPGFVCRIDGAPASASCATTPPVSAYWALWSSNGTSGTWAYASQGAGSLKVPAGGWVGFKFGNGQSAPGITPLGAAPAAPKPATKPKAETKPSSKPSASAEPSASASASAKAAEKKAKAKASASASASATPGAADDSTAGSDDIAKASNETDGSSSMVWVGAVLAGLLIIGMAAAVMRRRLAGRQP